MYCPGKSTSSYAIPRSFWYSVAFCVVFFALFATWILLKGNSSLAFARQMGIGLTLSLFIGFSISTIGIPVASSWSWSVPRHLLRQLFHPFSLCLFLQFLADMTYTFTYWDQVGVVYPTSADALSLASDVALLWGLLRLPMRSLVSTDRTRLLLDSLILIVTVITFSWYFTLGPTILSAVNKSPLAAAVSIAFPSCDLLLLSCTILFTTFLFAGK
ncbi:MAG TPA: hypothetical protein VFN35_22530, partial [Ktedonobacteraceae bacterium]|nr:hypothetical protein [Ktedonobacteraceae bacterium]